MSEKKLQGASSMVLDLLRLLCSLIVLISHSLAFANPESREDIVPSHLAHGCVVIFFVLSGYVIAYTSSSGHRSLAQYTIARFTRLYSIYIPAILVTIVCAILAYSINPEIFNEYNRGNNAMRYLTSILFLNEIWFYSSAPGINIPLWSLSYEFWYYAIFGAFFYRKKSITGWIMPVIIILIAGPKILLMMVIWIMGWMAYKINSPKISDTFAWIAITCILSIAIALMLLLPHFPYRLGSHPLYWAGSFVTDWVIGLVVAFSIWLLPMSKATTVVTTSAVSKRFREFANMTFPIYVLHYPILILLKCIIPSDITPGWQWFIIGSIALIICTILGLIFEKYKEKWKALFIWIFNKFSLLDANQIRSSKMPS